jgi:septal ring factor EnvC (AmiA/AmiB activator)
MTLNTPLSWGLAVGLVTAVSGGVTFALTLRGQIDGALERHEERGHAAAPSRAELRETLTELRAELRELRGELREVRDGLGAWNVGVVPVPRLPRAKGKR